MCWLPHASTVANGSGDLCETLLYLQLWQAGMGFQWFPKANGFPKLGAGRREEPTHIALQGPIRLASQVVRGKPRARCPVLRTSGWGGRGPPLQGMQLGAPPLKIIHLKSVLSFTSSSVHEVLRRPVLQHSSLLSSVLYKTWQRPFLAWRSQQFPAVKRQGRGGG